MSDSLAVLLHAAARGARLQCDENSGYGWEENWRPALPTNGDECKWRIHPKDVHLRYGPVSSALRKKAENPPWYIDTFSDVGMNSFCIAISDPEFSDYQDCKSHLTRSLFLLFVAESLVEEGL